ncbi:MAG: putative selenate reductase subunit YgfK [Bacteroidales bacterium]|nr:putative selenate reductase subunit YgfK [Bacteroidales bacterium]
MSDKFSIIPLKQLLQIFLGQIDKKKSFFGIQEELFFKPKNTDPFRLNLFGQSLETPIGVAAGPHSQLTQNIVAAWLCGARFIELKTIQTLDELEISKPCIDMQDEGYNCEWSQELKIEQSFDQYLNAWIIIHILKDKLKIGNTNEAGVIFNMSVGYDFAGILNKNVQWFFDKMNDSSTELKKKIEEIKDIYPNIVNLEINPQISNNVTLSTMHGCPPEEIEQIGNYLITEKKLHTTIKLNPTLLGKEKLQNIILNSGFETIIPDIAFEHDLKYNDAVGIIKRLKRKAEDNNLYFSLKLTNTLESLNFKDIFPSGENMMYASGRVLHPISINLAKRLQNEFLGKLNISFSGGADAFNISNIISSGLFPVTVCTDILKPGGYGKLNQYIENLRSEFSIKNHFLKNNNLDKLNQYAQNVLADKKYKRTFLHDKSIKINRKLNSFDCVFAPCVSTCPTNQNIPNYMYYTANGDFEKAFEVIMQTNPFPNTTGMVCDHQCQTKCTRINYDSPLQIREIKRFIAENAVNPKTLQTNNFISEKVFKVGIIGAGPSGLSCAWFLKATGFEVDVYETKQKPGGMISGAIPSFRITDEAINIDIKRIKKAGIKIHFGEKINKENFDRLRKEHDFIYVATGAQKVKEVFIEGQNTEGILNPLEFLFQVKEEKSIKIGQNIFVLGGGNTAMDAARTAKRLVNKNGNVQIIYRRTIKQMPADYNEIISVLDEEVEIMELISPVRINSKNGKIISLTCVKMKLGEKDESGRAKPVIIPNSEFEIKADTIIPAFGQDIDIDFIDHELLKQKADSYETQISNIFIGGDAMRGGSTVINAVADGRKTANEIIEKSEIKTHSYKLTENRNTPINELMLRKSKIIISESLHKTPEINHSFNNTSKSLTKEQAIQEASRCLLCDEICNICTTVCPNLALFSFETKTVKYRLQKIISNKKSIEIVEDELFEINQKHQILHLADWCNECGNCTTFCPTSGSPYKEKPHLYFNYKSFEISDEGYYFENSENEKITNKTNEQISSLTKENNYFIFQIDKYKIKLDLKTLRIINHNIKEKDNFEIKLTKAAEMSVLIQGAAQLLK